MIELELPSKPISDSILSKMLADKGMSIARRTVSKYREQMNIPPANQRKSVL
jgi:RNA polymerase sigma-54 factor